MIRRSSPPPSTIAGLRRGLLRTACLTAGLAAVFPLSAREPTAPAERLDLQTASIADLQRAMDAGALSSQRLVRLSLARIRAYEPQLHALISVAPDALAQARRLDAERRARGPRSPLHGIPVLVKDNIDTADLPTTLGFYGLKGARPRGDATVVARLRAAGAIVLAKTNLSELASGPALSSLGGQTRNPHALDRSPAGSSGGTAAGVAAGYAPLGIATDTTGSVRWPAASNGVVGLRPATGALPTTGVQPTAPSLDAVGILARSVADAALALRVVQAPSPARDAPDCAPDDAPLRGVRLGFARQDFSGDDDAVDAVVANALAQARAAGAEVVEIELPPWLLPTAKQLQAALVRNESAPSLDAYLRAAFAPPAPQSHAELLALAERLAAAPPADATPNPGRLRGYRDEAAAPGLDDPVYRAARDEGLRFFRASLDAALARQRLDALIFPTQTRRIERIGEPARVNARGLFGNFPGSLASLAGWPELTVPAGATADGLPVGMSLLIPARDQARLPALGRALERRWHGLRQPAATPPLAGEAFEYAPRTRDGAGGCARPRAAGASA
ncbi:amidase [Lysobacter sp. K5869]|uniref:amidase family protein n=1 Tax=Lysobacter sp. K5869 TaxID=2820808 RepID=UPI001C061C34|nr:amidase family protein [Lysobacter sp. K5869]QWP75425.1 amidase [Lysobacter sp. K5869]